MESSNPVITQFVLIMVLTVPGVAQPKILRKPAASFEQCQSWFKEAKDLLEAHEGEQFKFTLACEVTGNKADPA